MAESTKISSLTRNVPKFDGNAIRYDEWKSTTRAVLEISKNDVFEILTGENKRPGEPYSITQNTLQSGTHKVPVAGSDVATGSSSTELGYELIVPRGAQLYAMQTTSSNGTRQTQHSTVFCTW